MAEHSINLPNDPEAELLQAQLREAQILEAQILDASITQALETAPRLAIPADFAAKVAAQMPPLSEVRLTPRGYGRNAAILSMCVLLALIFIFANRAGASPLWASMEWLFCIQFALVAVWLAVRHPRPHVIGHL